MITQWYIKRHEGQLLPNFFPWHLDLESSLNKWHQEPNLEFFRTYTEPYEPKWASWEDYKKETKIRIIDTEKVHRDEINIFPIRFHDTSDNLWGNENNWPLNYMPENIISWLKQNPNVYIVLNDYKEAKPIFHKSWKTIPMLRKIKEKYQLKNKFIWLNIASPTSRDKFYPPTGDREIPPWLSIGCYNGCLQYSFRAYNENSFNIEYDEQIVEPDWTNYGRFLYYCGRPDPVRLILGNRLLKNIPKNQLWLNINKPDDKMSNLVKSLPYKYMKDLKEIDHGWYYKTILELEEILDNPKNTFPNEFADSYVKTNEGYNTILPSALHYNNIFIEIVSEFHNARLSQPKAKNINFITEKTFKSIYMERPFIISANPGHYEILKDLGFYTYDQWFDLNFTSNSNFDEHLNSLVNSVKKISKLSDVECQKMFKEMIPTIIHNKYRFKEIMEKEPRYSLQAINYVINNWTV